MNLYRCSRCTLIEDQDIVQDPNRKIGLVLHLIWPYDQASAKDKVYLCLDCFNHMRNWITDSREYFEDMADLAEDHNSYSLEVNSREIEYGYDMHAEGED